MVEKNLLDNPPEKVLAMYRAVVELVRDGADVNSMKVSDITARAGIGKGTAYEYFSSKEEIITNALAFDVLSKRKELEEIVDGEGTFPEKLERILDYIEQKFCESRTFCILVRIGTGSYEMSEALRAEYERVHENISCGELEEVMDRIMAQGIAEGVIKEENLMFRRMAFGSQMVAYAAYLMARSQGEGTEVTSAQAKKFVYKSLVKSLG